MAPECFVKNKEYKIDGRIDVWATGVILYAMLTGDLPFKGASPPETIEVIKSGKYKINPAIAKKLSPECLDMISKCLEVEPKKRPSMEDLQAHPWLNGNYFQPRVQKLEMPEEIKEEVEKE